MPVAVFHDFFAFPGGGESVALALARHFNASIYTGYIKEDMFNAMYWNDTHVFNLDFTNKFKLVASCSETLALMCGFQKITAIDTELAFFSGGISPLSWKKVMGKRVWYCHTPPRFLYDKKSYYLSGKSKLARCKSHALIAYYKYRLDIAIKNMDLIIANSKTVQERISRYLGAESIVIHPPCDIEKFQWVGEGKYYLSTARVDELKRVEMIVDAFSVMPDKKLIIVSGGSELSKIRKKIDAYQASNITLLGWVSQKQLCTLIGNCIATIYIPWDEDFGISPVESMGAGKPVIGVDEGGVRETVVHNQTGLLIQSPPTPEHIRQAVNTLSINKAKKMRTACEARAKAFSEEAFYAAIKNAIA